MGKKLAKPGSDAKHAPVDWVDDIAAFLGELEKPKLPKRIVRTILQFLQVGHSRRPDPPGVSISPGVLAGASERDPPVQICFSFDTTGSMSPYINHVRDQVSLLCAKLLREIPGIQVSIAAHGDYGDEANYVVKAIDFSNDVKELKKYIEGCTSTGGGDCPECYELVLQKMQELTWAATSAKALVMIGDAPPHNKAKYEGLGREFIDWRKEAEWYAERDIHLYGVRCGNSRESFYADIAKVTGALVIEIAQIELMPELFTELCFREQQRWAMDLHPPPAWEVRSIADPKAALLNVCGSCLLAESSFHEKVSTTKKRIRLLARRLAREGQGEFVLQMALYCRTKMYLRSVSNYLTCLATELPGCQAHVAAYFKEIVKLPTDMLEVAKCSITLRQGEEGKRKGQLWLPHGLRKALARKFPDFSEYQLAKHNKREKLGPDSEWISSSASRREPAKGKGKGKRKGAEVKEEAEKPDLSKCPVLSLKSMVRLCHIGEPHELVMKVLGSRYPVNEEEFRESGLPGAFDEKMGGVRMRLAVPATFQTELSKGGNNKESWQRLIDKQGLPYMAMLRNLRNLLTVDLEQGYHEILLKRLQDPRQVESSQQMPHRFLTAFLAVDAAIKGESFGKGGGKAKGKGRGRRAPAEEAGEEEAGEAPKPLPQELGERYKAALNTAVQHAVAARLGPLKGKTLVLCDVSGSMRYNDFAQSAKGIAGVAQAADLAILMGLLLWYMAEAAEDCRVALFSDGEPRQLALEKEKGVLPQFQSAKEHVKDMGLATELPSKWLQGQLETFPADRVVIFSDMLIGMSRDHPGGGGKLQEVLKEHRATKPDCTLVCVDLFGSGATTGVDLTGDAGKGDVLLSGFSDHMLSYIAEPSMKAQVQDVERILETLRAEEEAKAKAKAAKGKRKAREGETEATEGAEEMEETEAEAPEGTQA